LSERLDAFTTHYLREIGVVTPCDAADLAPLGTALASAKDAQDAQAQMAALAEQARDCRRCALADSRTQVVFGTGDPTADLVFIGEAPGRDEDLKGEPFVGKAGKLLDKMLAAIGLDRRRVYIMNTIKCRPPGNRDPQPDEVAACHDWFARQLAILRPKVICLLGRVAAQKVLGTEAPLRALRGRWHELDGVPVLVSYHPAYLLRSPAQKRQSWQDLLTLVERLRG